MRGYPFLEEGHASVSFSPFFLSGRSAQRPLLNEGRRAQFPHDFATVTKEVDSEDALRCEEKKNYPSAERGEECPGWLPLSWPAPHGQ